MYPYPLFPRYLRHPTPYSPNRLCIYFSVAYSFVSSRVITSVNYCPLPRSWLDLAIYYSYKDTAMYPSTFPVLTGNASPTFGP